MTQLALLDSLLHDMPPVAAMEIRAAEFDGDSLRLRAPLSVNVNDKSCAFGGSQASLMTIACWGWLVLKLREADARAEVYVADSQIRYLAPLFDDLEGRAQLAEGQDWDAVVQCLRDRRRARASMTAQMHNARGDLVATLQARFALIGMDAVSSRGGA